MISNISRIELIAENMSTQELEEINGGEVITNSIQNVGSKYHKISDTSFCYDSQRKNKGILSNIFKLFN